MALGGGGFVGSVGEPTQAVKAGFAGATTDTGHQGSSGSFGMLRPGVPDVQLQTDFGWRSEQMMAVVSKQLIAIFYGKQPIYSYLLRSIFMSTWGFFPAVFRPLRTVFPGLGAGFLNRGGKTGRTAKKRGKNEQKWARNGLKRVRVS